jgi:excisionase family DNA binding protein
MVSQRTASQLQLPPLAPQKTASVRAFKDISGLSPPTIYRLLAAGDLASIRIGRKRLILLSSWDELIARRQVAEASR